MTRSDIVKKIMANINDSDIVVASTGFISREVYSQKDRPLNFYMMGSMGNALAIGIGLALNTDNKVYVINGDGSALMSLGTMVTAKSLRLTNLWHYIIDNNCHESTGGQKTASDSIHFPYLNIDTTVYHCSRDINVPPRIEISGKNITKRFRNAFKIISDKQFKYKLD